LPLRLDRFSAPVGLYYQRLVLWHVNKRRSRTELRRFAHREEDGDKTTGADFGMTLPPSWFRCASRKAG